MQRRSWRFSTRPGSSTVARPEAVNPALEVSARFNGDEARLRRDGSMPPARCPARCVRVHSAPDASCLRRGYGSSRRTPFLQSPIGRSARSLRSTMWPVERRVPPSRPAGWAGAAPSSAPAPATRHPGLPPTPDKAVRRHPQSGVRDAHPDRRALGTRSAAFRVVVSPDDVRRGELPGHEAPERVGVRGEYELHLGCRVNQAGNRVAEGRGRRRQVLPPVRQNRFSPAS